MSTDAGTVTMGSCHSRVTCAGAAQVNLAFTNLRRKFYEVIKVESRHVTNPSEAYSDDSIEWKILNSALYRYIQKCKQKKL